MNHESRAVDGVRASIWRPMRPAPLVLLAIACAPPPASDQCDGTTARCEVGNIFTYCDNGTFRRITCKGPKGCTDTTCDTSTHTVGDPCPFSLYRCDPVSTERLLQCVGGVLKTFRTCSGPRQCYFENNNIGCDATIGDTCPAAYAGRYFCDSVDIQQTLTCSDGGISFYSKCAGAKNCLQGDGGLICQ